MFHYFKRDFDAYSDLEVLTINFEMAEKQYPECQFILTQRDLDSWLDSRQRHVERNIRRKAEGRYRRRWLIVDREAWTREWQSHHEKVIRYFQDKPGKLLVMNVLRGDGYAVLCPFVGKAIPNEPFPWKNQRKLTDTPNA